MSKRLTFQVENGKLAIKFDDQPIPTEKIDNLFATLAADMDSRVKQLSAAAADSQNGPLRVGSVQIGICGDDDPKTLPRLIPPCPRCGYCGFIEDADMNLAGVCPECNGAGMTIIHHNNKTLRNTTKP